MVWRSRPRKPAEQLESPVVQREDPVPLGLGPPRLDHPLELLGQLT